MSYFNIGIVSRIVRLNLFFSTAFILLLTVALLAGSFFAAPWIIYTDVSDCGIPGMRLINPGDIVVASGYRLKTIRLGCYDPAGLERSKDGRYLLIPQPEVLKILDLESWRIQELDPLGFGSNYVWAAFSPDGKSLLFTGNQSTEYYNRYELYLMELNGAGKVKRLTATPAMHKPLWSPDGTQIVFIGLGVNDQADLFLINRDGTGQVNLTNSPGSDLLPLFTPSGTQLFWTGQGENDLQHHLFMMELSTREITQLTAGEGQNYIISDWSPDGKSFIYHHTESTGVALYRFETETKTSSQLLWTGATGGGVDWSADGQRILYANDAASPLYAHLCTLDIFTNEETCTGLTGHWLSEPLWLE
jgi:Tol biopolymer transport system component